VTALLATGVGVGDLAVFIAYQLGFVVVPGCLTYMALARLRPGPLRLWAIGSAVGYVLAVLAFALTAALHVRWALWAYPPLTVAAAVLAIRRRALTTEAEPPLRGAAAWSLAGVCVLTILYVSFAYFATAPLPDQVSSVAYLPDLVFHLGVAADALHHWPIADPKIAGVALPYHTFVHMSLAETTQITGIPVATVMLRLYLLPLIVLVIGQLCVAGRAIGGRAVVGVVAAALFLLVGQLGLDRRDPLLFYNTVFFSLYSSPPYLLGLALFVPALLVLWERLADHARDPRGWLLLALLLVGCAGAKASILPVLLGGLVLYGLWHRTRRVAVALGLTALVFAVTYLVMYRGESGGLTFNPPGSIRSMAPISFAEPTVAGALGHPLFWIAATIVGLVGFCAAPLAGAPAALRERGSGLLLGVLVASLVPFIAYSHIGGSQNFFAYYGLCAAAILSARGLLALWDGRRGRPLALAAAAWVALLLALALIPLAGASPPSRGTLYALWIVVPAAAVAVLLVLALRRRVPVVMAVGAIVLWGALDTPLHVGSFVIGQLEGGNRLYATDGPQAFGLTKPLFQALRWVRDHTPTATVLAVNNQFAATGRRSPIYYYYSAFDERRSFLEGWYDSIPGARLGAAAATVTPFPDRLSLNDAVFLHADQVALRTMERGYGVRYLFVDRLHGPDDPRLASLGRVVFANAAAVVYRVS
jgi:hypothetical protein